MNPEADKKIREALITAYNFKRDDMTNCPAIVFNVWMNKFIAAIDAEPIDPKPCESVEELMRAIQRCTFYDEGFKEVMMYHNEARAIIKSFLSAHDAEKDTRIKELENPWISVTDKLPDIDEYVLWRLENGSVFQEAIDKDWDKEWFDGFFKGYKNTGPIAHWMKVPQFKEPTP